MSKDPDLHRALSLRPLPFYDLQENSSPRSHSPALSISRGAVHHNPAASTSVEPLAPSKHSQEPIVRPTYARSDGSAGSDPENAVASSQFTAEDPFQLASKMKTDEQLAYIRANTSKKRAKVVCGSLPTTSEHKAKKLQEFYEQQNENISRLLKPVDDHRREAREEAGSDQLKFKIAVNGSFLANVLLDILQVYGAVSSGSLSLFTTMADAIFDPMSNLTLILCNRAVNRVDSRKYPSGKARIETAGNICFCFLMTAVSFLLIVLSAKELADGHNADTTKFHLPSVIAVAVALVTKLGLFLYCWALRNKYSQIRILWEDHRNDLFINGFGILTSVGGSKLKWWIDPMGAMILSVLISCLWLHTAYSEFQLLIGVTADTSILQLITYISMTHSDSIVGLDTVRAWHSGPRLIVEVDIVMDERRTLKDTHDIAEELQTKLEGLPDVERCYVHVDYETSHAPEHFTKKTL